METPRTKYKLDEAKFFLRLLKEEDQKTTREWPEAFGYLLSAFLSAARSVTFAFQNDAKEEYDRWSPKWYGVLKPEDQELMDFMKEQRRIEIHAKGAETVTQHKAIPAELVPGIQVFGPPAMFLGEHHAKAAKEAGVPSWSQAWIWVPQHFFDVGGRKIEAIKVCERYVALLEHAFADFHKTYPNLQSQGLQASS